MNKTADILPASNHPGGSEAHAPARRLTDPLAGLEINPLFFFKNRFAFSVKPESMSDNFRARKST
jgi:hypothetical protein